MHYIWPNLSFLSIHCQSNPTIYVHSFHNHNMQAYLQCLSVKFLNNHNVQPFMQWLLSCDYFEISFVNILTWVTYLWLLNTFFSYSWLKILKKMWDSHKGSWSHTLLRPHPCLKMTSINYKTQWIWLYMSFQNSKISCSYYANGCRDIGWPTWWTFLYCKPISRWKERTKEVICSSLGNWESHFEVMG